MSRQARYYKGIRQVLRPVTVAERIAWQESRVAFAQRRLDGALPDDRPLWAAVVASCERDLWRLERAAREAR